MAKSEGLVMHVRQANDLGGKSSIKLRTHLLGFHFLGPLLSPIIVPSKKLFLYICF